ncbi:hypothetical protein [Parenemella sanctibonifatiensis]|uniref:hypothetical protein n=1 Tax=Parenemella sanctibonifatiensis TaxID=2016505 RepID=UPI001186FA56|nr:hypothetical protein [Parenemella sanctibonifatiensis]
MRFLLRGGLPRDDYDELVTFLGRRPNVLAWAHGAEAVRGQSGDPVLAVGGKGAMWLKRGGEWSELPWSEIERGFWDAERSRLRWELPSGEKDRIVLTEPGRMPVHFRERVQSSVRVRRELDLPTGEKILITARQDLRPGGTVVWRRKMTRGPGWTEKALALVDDEIARLKIEHDIS